MGKQNVARANDFGNFKAEIYEAVKGAEAYSIFKSEDIKFLDKKYQTKEFVERNKKYKYHERVGMAGCFASHYLLWKKCVELNETIGIFEYDAKQLRIMPNIDFNDLLSLTGWYAYGPQDTEELINGTKGLHPYTGYNRWGFNNVMMEAPAYMIKPHAAASLVNTAKTKGWFPVDRFMSTDIVDISKQTFSPMIFHQIRKTSLTDHYST